MDWANKFPGTGTAKEKVAHCHGGFSEAPVTRLASMNISNRPCGPVFRSDFVKMETTQNRISLAWQKEYELKHDDLFSNIEYKERTKESIILNATEARSRYHLCKPLVRCFYHCEKLKIEVEGFSLKLENADTGEVVNRLCLPAGDIFSEANGRYEYDFHELLPFTTYRLVIAEFKDTFAGSHDDNGKFRESAVLEVELQTKSYRPTGEPKELNLLSATDSRFAFRFEEPQRSLRNGVIEMFTVYLELRTQILVKNVSGGLKTILSDEAWPDVQFAPNTEYAVSVMAWTDYPEPGPRTEKLVFQTCPENMKRDGLKPCYPVSGYFEHVDGHAYPCESVGAHKVDLSSCFEGQTTVANMKIKAGFWRADLASLDIRPCPNRAFCSGQDRNVSVNATSDLDVYCRIHHTGIYCQDCIDGFEMLGTEGCVQCPTGSGAVMYQAGTLAGFLVVFALVVAFAIYIPCSAAKVKKEEAPRQSPEKKSKCEHTYKLIRSVSSWPRAILFGVKFRILLGFFQVLRSFARTFGSHKVDNQSVAVQSIEIFGIFANLDLAFAFRTVEFQCYVYELGHPSKVIFTTLASLFVLAAFWSVFKLAVRCVNLLEDVGPARTNATINTGLYFTFYFLNLIYPNVSHIILGTFNCEYFYGSEDVVSSALRVDYRTLCDESLHATWVYAVVMTVVFPVGVPALFFWAIWRNSSKNTKDAKTAAPSNPASFLTEPYKGSMKYFEVHELLRKLVQTSVFPLLQSWDYTRTEGNAVMEALAATLCVIYASVVFQLRPYQEESDTEFAAASLVVLCLVALVGTLDPLNKLEFIEPGTFTLIILELLVFMVYILKYPPMKEKPQGSKEAPIPDEHDDSGILEGVTGNREKHLRPHV